MAYMGYLLKTDRLLLRRWQKHDLLPFAKINTDPGVMEFYPSCLSIEESQQFIDRAEEKFERDGFGFWAIEGKATNEFMGFVGLNIPNFDAAFMPCVEIGWRLGKKYWGNGYATEGARVVLNYAFNQAGLKEVLAWTNHGNKRSRKVMERIGMRHAPNDDFDHPSLPEGHSLRPHVLYRISAPQVQ
jgi:RimJ/RimL family protein N-acetyltransferase